MTTSPPSEPGTEGRAGFDRRMSRDEINDLPIRRFEGAISIVRDREGLQHALEELRKEKVLGFDTETRPAFKKGQSYKTALLQLCGRKRAYLFQLNLLKFPRSLRSLLADDQITKAGVAPEQDVKKLQELGDFRAKGFVDVSKLAQEAGIKNHGLRGLAAVMLGFRVSKRAQLSQWDRKELAPAQVQYAATDAWVSRELFLKLHGNHTK